jgi:hypothetical protein
MGKLCRRKHPLKCSCFGRDIEGLETVAMGTIATIPDAHS